MPIAILPTSPAMIHDAYETLWTLWTLNVSTCGLFELCPKTFHRKDTSQDCSAASLRQPPHRPHPRYPWITCVRAMHTGQWTVTGRSWTVMDYGTATRVTPLHNHKRHVESPLLLWRGTVGENGCTLVLFTDNHELYIPCHPFKTQFLTRHQALWTVGHPEPYSVTSTSCWLAFTGSSESYSSFWVERPTWTVVADDLPLANRNKWT